MTAEVPTRITRVVTEPDTNKLVRHIARSAAIWNVGSPLPRRSGASVAPGLTAPGKVMVRSTGSARSGLAFVFMPLTVVRIDDPVRKGQDVRVTTPFDDPQAELAWMFLQYLADDGDLDEGFSLLSDDFVYWNNHNRASCDKARLRAISEWRKPIIEFTFELISCLNEGENVVIEALTDGVTSAGVRYDSPVVFIFETRDGLITSLREYGDTRLSTEAFGAFGVIPE
jgi:ketosteroid isomerase-like protein